jgi:riboflavin transporter FmnP
MNAGRNKMDTKKFAFAIMMGALGSAFFAVSFYLVPIAAGINLDFSLLAVFIAGFFGGPIVGAVAGLIAGILPGIMFGPLGFGGVLGLIGLPFGKALSGLASGFISKSLRIGSENQRSSILGVPTSFLSYVPEAFFTVGYFAVLQSSVLAGVTFYSTAILPKALVELTIISVIMAALIGNNGFCKFTSVFTKKQCRIKTNPQHN